MNAAAVRFDGVSIALGGRTVLDDVSFAVPSGAFVGVLGPNGAGKTTAMRATLGLLRPTRGSITVLGGRPTRGNRLIGYVPQARSPVTARLRGSEVVAAVARGGRWGLPLSSRALRREVDRALERVGAGALAARPLAELSGGERQRLLLAQALVGKPLLLLLDEPLISLDPPGQRAIIELARDVQRQLGITVLFSAHELNPLLGALDRVLYLGGGGAALGTVDEVITAPVLSRLYRAPIDVLRVGGRIFVMSGAVEVERDPCRHGQRHEREHGQEAGAH